ncbi:MAG: hypothetical protein ABL931_15315 [Usitatibacteraceae bacterium]
MKIRSLGFVVAAFSITAFAQAPAPATPAAPAPAAVEKPLAKHSCAQPPMPDASKKITVPEANAFVRVLETYRNCVSAFTDGQKQIAEGKQKEAEGLRASALESAAVAAAAVAAANAAAKEYNTYSEAAIKIVTPKEEGDGKKSSAAEPAAPRPSKSY